MKDNGGVYFVPAFAGLGAPHWDSYARGAIFGLTRGASAAHIARAALEAIAFQNVDVLNAMQKDAAITLTELRGLTQQEAADLTGISLSGMKSRVQRGRRMLRTMFEECCRLTMDGRGRVIQADRWTCKNGDDCDD